MRLLVDTHAAIWFVRGDKLLPSRVRAAIAEPSNEVWCSAASIWEAAIKHGMGKLNLTGGVDGFVSMVTTIVAATVLPVTAAHGVRYATLPQ